MTEVDDSGLDSRFWLKTAGVVIVGGIVALIVFFLIGWAWFEFGIIGMFALVALLLLGVSWIHDRREQRQAAEDRALLSE